MEAWLGLSVPLPRLAAAVVVATVLAGHGKRKGSLSTSGAVAAFAVGFLHWVFSYEAVAMLLAFYLSSSRLTKYQAVRKKALEEDFKEGGQRNAVQVGRWTGCCCRCCLEDSRWLGRTLGGSSSAEPVACPLCPQ
jgi:uncharacterized membrane protein